MTKEWQEKVEAHLAEYAYFASSQTYLFEALNLIQQLESDLEAKDKLLFAYESTGTPRRDNEQ